MFELAILTIFPAAVAFAGAMDLFTMTIPNRVSLAAVTGFILLVPFAGLTPADIGAHLAAGLLVLAIGIALFIPGWIGGGDAKLAAAVALWVGLDFLLPFLVYAALAGGALALIFMTLRAHPLPLPVCAQPWAVRLHDHRTGIPYGVALAAGALLVYPHTAWFTTFGG